MKIPDETLVQQAQRGNERAFEQLVRRYHERIINVCFRIIGDFQIAEEAAMDTFLTAPSDLSISFLTSHIFWRCALLRAGRCSPIRNRRTWKRKPIG